MTQDDSYNPMGLNKLRATAEAAKAQAGHAVPVLLGQVARARVAVALLRLCLRLRLDWVSGAPPRGGVR